MVNGRAVDGGVWISLCFQTEAGRTVTASTVGLWRLRRRYSRLAAVGQIEKGTECLFLEKPHK